MHIMFVSLSLLSFGSSGFQLAASSLSARSRSRFLPVEREVFLATVLTWGFRLWVSASVKHPQTVLFVKRCYTKKSEINLTELKPSPV